MRNLGRLSQTKKRERASHNRHNSARVYMIAPRMLLSVKVYADQTLTVEKGVFGNVSTLVETGKTLEVAVDVSSGGAIDVFLMSSEDKINWEKYVEGQLQSFTYISQVSSLKTKLFRYTFIVPQQDTYFLVSNVAGSLAEQFRLETLSLTLR